VFGPDLSVPNTQNLLFRNGNRIVADISSFSPSDPNHTGTPVNDLFYMTGSCTLSRDGTVIGTGAFPSAASFTVPADTGRYVLAIQANRSRPWTALAPTV